MDKYVITACCTFKFVRAYILFFSSRKFRWDLCYKRYRAPGDITSRTIQWELRHSLFRHGCIMPEKSWQLLQRRRRDFSLVPPDFEIQRITAAEWIYNV